MFTIQNLRCESATNPLGIDRLLPRLSWQLHGTSRGLTQTAYQIQAAATLEALQADQPDLWDSGKVLSGQNVSVTYAGAGLLSSQRAYWRVRAWDNHNSPSEFSDPAWFEMGLLHPDDWLAEWIGYPVRSNGSALYLRHAFTITKPIARARLYAAGLGLVELRLNGQAVNDRVLDPAPTDTAQRVLYTTDDVTDRLQAGKNVVAAILGNGWYGVPKLILQLRLDFSDGSTDWVVSGKNERFGTWWQTASGPITFNGVYDGENYDARLENPGWDTPARSDDEFFPYAMWVEPPGGRLVAQTLEPIQVVDTLPARSIQQPKPGVYVFDFGQNLAGWGRLQIQGENGQRVTLRFAESLYEDGTINQENLRQARASDEYILKGGAVEIWEPRFTYHGFRYVQLEGVQVPPDEETLHARVVRSSVQPAGEFECSHALLNRIHTIVRWTEASNLHGLPTDCPQRDERMGWMNDLAARTEEALCNFDMARLFAKFSADIADAQDARGAIPDTVPYRWGNRPADPVSVAFLLIPWQLYRWYGDRQVLADHFDAMRRWVDFLFSRTEGNLLTYSYYGDWAPPVAEALPGGDGASPLSRQTPGELVSTAYLYYHANLLANIAGVLGRSNETEYYQRRAAAVATAYHQRFWDAQTGGYGSNNQACNTLSLYMGLVPEHLRQGVLANLVQDIEAHDHHLTTGNLCTKYLLETLSDMGRGDVALHLATQTSYPSWGYMIENGATTVWERWEKATGGGMNSHNHPMLASVGSWLYKYVAGIDLQPDAAAFNQVLIYPRVSDSLDWVRASLVTVQGRVVVAWQREEGDFILQAQIPPNCRARLVLPVKTETWKLIESGNLLWQSGGRPQSVEGITNPILSDGHIVCELASGAYNFQLQSANFS